MKNKLLFIALIGIATCINLLVARQSYAAGCTNPSTNYGTVTLVDSVSSGGTYRLWTRMAVPNSTDTNYLLEVDGSSCYVVGGSTVPVYSNGASSHFLAGRSNWIPVTTTGSTLDVNLSAGSHTFKLIGTAVGVILDRFLLTADTTCVPIGNGANCTSIYQTADINTDAQVNFRDLSLFATKYNQTGSSLGRADMNGDGTVDILDYSILASKYGSTTANTYAVNEVENGSRSGNMATVGDGSASNGTAIGFGIVATAGCVGAANTPGGTDPWGGCWPGPQNTGYPHGLTGDSRTPVTLTAYTGPNVITSCGVVIDQKITSWLNINVGNGTHSKDTPCVTIKNSLVQGIVFSDDSSYGPVLIQDTEIDSDGSLPYAENAGRYNYFVYRVNSHGGQGVIKCAAYCETKDNWIHGMTLGNSYHYNAIGGNGMEAGSWNIEHNWASCGDWESVDPSYNPSGAGCSSVIGFYGDFAPVRNITVTRNFMQSAFTMSTGAAPNQDAQAGYCLNPGYYVGKPYPNPTNMTITDNIFARSLSGKCAIFGPTNSLNQIGQGSTNVWSGNQYTDGTVINRVEE